MPLARIITSTPEEALPIAERLRAQGYAVETVAPGVTTSDRNADLELKLEHATAAEVLGTIAQRTAADAADVYIGAGVFQAAPVPVSATPRRNSAGAPTVADTMNGVAAGLQNKRDLLAKALREQRMLSRDARQAERLQRRLADAARSDERPADQPLRIQPPLDEAPANPVSVAESYDDRAPVANEKVHAPTEDALAFGCETASPTTPVEPFSLPVHLDPPVESPVTQVPSVEEPGFAEYRAEEPLPVAVVRPAAGHIRDAAGRVAVRSLRRRLVRINFRTGKRLSRRANEWRAAVLISCLFAALLMMGWAIVARGPVSPLPRSFSANPNVQQAVPFGAATLGPPTAATAPMPGSLPTPDAATPEKTRSADRAGNKSQVSGSRTSGSNRNEARRNVGPKERVRRTPEEDIAEDEVIYHRSAPKPTPAQKEKASLKRFSD